jgi:hypothetical protein
LIISIICAEFISDPTLDTDEVDESAHDDEDDNDGDIVVDCEGEMVANCEGDIVLRREGDNVADLEGDIVFDCGENIEADKDDALISLTVLPTSSTILFNIMVQAFLIFSNSPTTVTHLSGKEKSVHFCEI